MTGVGKVLMPLLVLALLFPNGALLAHPDAGPGQTSLTQEEEEEDLQLVTAKVSAHLAQPGRVLMSARGNHWVYDSVPPLNGPNEEVNPLDGMLAALIACGMYIYEAVALEQEIEIDNLSATAQGELDPRGGSGAADVNPRVRAFHVTINVDGPTAEEAAIMAEAFGRRCPIYTTLALSAPIEVVNVVDGEAQEPIATEADPIVERDEAEGAELNLVFPQASGRMVAFGRSLMSARGNHWIYDSVPPIEGPNEEVNPLDALVGALPACGIMIYEAVARDEGIPLHHISADVEADLDPRGVAGADVNPRIRAFRVTFNVSGPTGEEAEMMAEQYRRRCPIYTTFERAAPIEVTNVIVDPGLAPDRSIQLTFVDHIEAGMVEPDVHLIDPDNEGMVFRMDPELAAADESLLDQVVYGTAEGQEHDMFEVGENPRGPFEMGEALDFTMAEWLAATGSGTYTIDGGKGHLDLSFSNLVPNGVYTLWCSRIYTPPNFEIVSLPCGEANGTNNSFVADEEGNGALEVTILPLPETEEDRISLFALAYHSDGETHGTYHGDFSRVTHVQSFAILPPYSDEAWRVANDAADSQVHHAAGTVVTHPSTGAMGPIEGATAEIYTTKAGATAHMQTVGLNPGHVYTAWWVIANNPAACDNSPCSPQDLLGKQDEVQTEVTYADGVIAGENGEANFAAYLPAGEVTNNPWFGHHFPDPTAAEIHLVINTHGPVIPEMVDEMLSSYRAGCSDDSLPPPFPDTAKADGEPGPNSCGLMQAAVFQPADSDNSMQATTE